VVCGCGEGSPIPGRGEVLQEKIAGTSSKLTEGHVEIMEGSGKLHMPPLSFLIPENHSCSVYVRTKIKIVRTAIFPRIKIKIVKRHRSENKNR